MKTIELTNGLLAVVDDCDYEKLSGRTWSFLVGNKTHYASCRIGAAKLLMHREIIAAKPGEFVDHIDGNGLNNVRSNLRICTHSENLRNQQNRTASGLSRYLGVSLDKRKKLKKWRSYLTIDYKFISLGMYATEEEAAIARDSAAKEMYGEYAVLNFP